MEDLYIPEARGGVSEVVIGVAILLQVLGYLLIKKRHHQSD